MSEIKSTVEVKCPDGEWIELPVTVTFDYHPAERETRYDLGCDASVELTSVMDARGGEMLEDLDVPTIERLEQEAMKHVAGCIEDARLGREMARDERRAEARREGGAL